MKLPRTLTLCLLAAGLAPARAQEIKLNLPGKSDATPAANSAQPAATPAPAPAPKFTDAQLTEELGWFVARRSGIGALEFSKEEIEGILKGVRAAAEGKEAPYNIDDCMPAVQALMQKRGETYEKAMAEKMRPQLEAAKKKSMEEALAFFTKLKENKAVVETPSGLRYEIVKPGEGANPKPTDTVIAHYTGTLLNGKVFDSSVERGKPETFPLNGVIPGWTEGLQKIAKGGKIKLYIPPHLAYGDDGAGEIPPGSTLVFEVELLEINPAPAK